MFGMEVDRYRQAVLVERPGYISTDYVYGSARAYNLDSTTDPADMPNLSSTIGGPKHRELIHVRALDQPVQYHARQG
jgi:hypothetical protein